MVEGVILTQNDTIVSTLLNVMKPKSDNNITRPLRLNGHTSRVVPSKQCTSPEGRSPAFAFAKVTGVAGSARGKQLPSCPRHATGTTIILFYSFFFPMYISLY